MFRKLSLALAVSAALSPVGVFALGLGELSTDSALNENFNANIELVSVAPGELDTIKVTLASSADFARAGLERPFLLSKLRFEPTELDDGRQVIWITSEDPVREPFLNFLLEVNWPKGRLIREVTVLLDPPVTLERPPPTIAPAVTVPVERVLRAAPEISQGSSSEPLAEPMLAAAASVGEYGPVRKGTNLWRIAKELDVPGVTTEQVAIAVFRLNPQSFAGSDINKLMAGEILRLPARSFIESLSPRQASAEFFARAEGRPGTVPVSRDGRLQIATKPADTEKPAGTRGGEIERVKTDIKIVREASESTRQETEELRSRIRELESQLADIRTLVKLKSDQLAEMQSTQIAPLAAEEGVPALVPEEPPMLVSEVAPEPEPGLPEEVVEAEETPPQQTMPEPELVEEAESLAENAIEQEPDSAEQPATEAAAKLVAQPEPQPRPAAIPAETRPKPALHKPAEEPGLLSNLISDPAMMGTGGAVALVLMSLGWLLIRRRRQMDDQFQESMLVESGETSTTVALESESEVAEQQVSEEETSFISDFSPSDIDALQEETGEVDPAAEADVYIAYGRYQQAENLVNQAIEKDPERLDLKAKLLEIYFTTKNAAAFSTLAEKLHSAGAPAKDPQIWKQVQSMGQELVPGHALFGAPTATKPGVGSVPADFTRVESGAGAAEESEALMTDSEALAGLELDLDTELSEPNSKPFGDYEDSVDVPQSRSPDQSGLPSRKQASAPETVKEESEFSLDLADLDSLEDINVGVGKISFTPDALLLRHGMFPR